MMTLSRAYLSGHKQCLTERMGGTSYLFFKPEGHPVNSGRMQKSHQMTGGWNA